jgi:hypothetical protein
VLVAAVEQRAVKETSRIFSEVFLEVWIPLALVTAGR